MLLKSISENILMPYNHIVVMIKSVQHQEWYIERERLVGRSKKTMSGFETIALLGI
jgi:phenylpyruvate tautomerase PptA (4-oxalocrotonate tautomerase family)